MHWLFIIALAVVAFVVWCVRSSIKDGTVDAHMPMDEESWRGR